jgi:hypothetical protein
MLSRQQDDSSNKKTWQSVCSWAIDFLWLYQRGQSVTHSLCIYAQHMPLIVIELRGCEVVRITPVVEYNQSINYTFF